MIKTSLANLSLRGLTLVSKFILILFIARFLTPEELGIWGLIFVTINMSLLVLGLDFYLFNTRELLARDTVERAVLIRDQFVFHLIAYTLVLPALLIVFAIGMIAWKYAVWFYILLVLEHVSQELYRLLITFSRPVMANFILFLRTGFWIFLAIVLAYYSEDLRGLPLFWACWIGGGVISIVLALYSLRNLEWRAAFKKPVNREWIKKGIKISLPFFLSTLSFTGIQFADRYFIQYFHGEGSVGIYTFYANIANVIHTFILSGVIVILYPKLVESFQAGKLEEYRMNMRKMMMGVIAGLIILPIIAALLIDPVLRLVDKEVYADHSNIFYIMMGTVALLTLSYIPHYALFVRHRDKIIIYSAIAALAVALVANTLLVPSFELRGAAFATLSAMGILFVFKVGAAVYYRKSEDARDNGTDNLIRVNKISRGI